MSTTESAPNFVTGKAATLLWTEIDWDLNVAHSRSLDDGSDWMEGFRVSFVCHRRHSGDLGFDTFEVVDGRVVSFGGFYTPGVRVRDEAGVVWNVRLVKCDDGTYLRAELVKARPDRWTNGWPHEAKVSKLTWKKA